MLNKKAQEIPVLKTIIIIFTLGILLITYFVMLYQANKIEINDKKLTQQLILHNIISKNCFSDKDLIATIEEDEFNQENFDFCMEQFKESSSLKISLGDDEIQTMYYNKEDFQERVRFKNIVTTSHYSKHKIPITLITQINGLESTFLNIEIITSK